jgi:hypothetical protein
MNRDTISTMTNTKKVHYHQFNNKKYKNKIILSSFKLVIKIKVFILICVERARFYFIFDYQIIA